MPAAEALKVVGLSRTQIATLYGVKARLLRRYLPPDQPAWVGVPPELLPKTEATVGQGGTEFALPPCDSSSVPAPHSVDAIRLKLNVCVLAANPKPLLNVSIKDPVYCGRELFNASAKVLAGSGITFDFPDIVAPAGAALWITLASDQLDFGSLLTGAEVELLLMPKRRSRGGAVTQGVYGRSAGMDARQFSET